MDFGTAITTCITKCVTFKGRASRSEYWKFYLFAVICYVCAYLLDIWLGTTMTDVDGSFGGGALLWFAIVLFAVPTISASVRRLHDTDRSGWWFLIQFIPIVGPLVLLIWMCTPGTDGVNSYGPDPSDPEADTAAVFE